MARVRSLLLAPAAIVAIGGALTGSANAQQVGEKEIRNITPGANGDVANPYFSKDNRLIRHIAFDTSATNIVPGFQDANGKRDVLVFKRNITPGSDKFGGTFVMGSLNSSEQAANGDSILPSLDGQTQPNKGPYSANESHCVSFQSQATNLDSEDRSPDWDVFVRDLKKGTTQLVSLGKANATHGQLDGECEFVTFEAGGSVFARDMKSDQVLKLGRGSNPDQQANGQGVAYERKDARGISQVHYQAFGRSSREGRPLVKTDDEVLVSESVVTAGAGGNGDSYAPDTSDNGDFVTFTSRATDFGFADANGASPDLFRRTLNPSAAAASDGPVAHTAKKKKKKKKKKKRRRHATPQDFTPFTYDNVTAEQLTGIRLGLASASGEQCVIIQVTDNGNGTFTVTVYFCNRPRSRRTNHILREFEGRGWSMGERPVAMSSRGNFLAATGIFSGVATFGATNPWEGMTADPPMNALLLFFEGGSHEGQPAPNF